MIDTAEAAAAANGDALILNFSVPAKSIYRNKSVASVTIPVSIFKPQKTSHRHLT